MLNMTEFSKKVVADNEISINGVFLKVTDEIAKKVLLLCLNSDITTPDSDKKESEKEGKSAKKQSLAEKDLQCHYEIAKQTSVDGKTLFCISRGKTGWIKCQRDAINSKIKALPGIITIKVTIPDSNKSFYAWGYKTRKKAEEMAATLPTVITKDEINSFVRQ